MTIIDPKANAWDALTKPTQVDKGGAGSGNWGHAGRPGLPGGSQSRHGGVPPAAQKQGGISRNEAVSKLGLRDTIHLNQLLKHGMPSEKIGNRRYVKWPEAQAWHDAYTTEGGGRRGITAANATLQIQQPKTPTNGGTTAGSKFYSGNLALASAEQVLKGSSPEVQALARRTGIVATDEHTFAYVEKSASTFEKPDSGMIKRIQEMDAEAVTVSLDRMARLGANPDSDAVHWSDNPVQVLGAQSHWDRPFQRWGEPRPRTATRAWRREGFTDDEKLLMLKVDARFRHEKAATLKADGTRYLRWDKETVVRTNTVKWMQSEGLWDDAVNLTARIKAAEAIDHVAAFGGVRYKYKNIPMNHRLLDMPAGQIDLRVTAHHYRNEFVKNKRKLGKGGYTPVDMMALVNPSRGERQAVQSRIDRTWDSVNHGGFRFDTYRIYKIIPSASAQQRYDDAKTKYGASTERMPGDKTLSNSSGAWYHGTHYVAGRSIAAGGYVIPKQVKTGRMLGNGVYLANNSSKSSQYIGTGFGRGQARGLILENKIVMGTEQKWNGANTYSSNFNTLWAPKRANPRSLYGGLINDEFVIRDAASVLPVYWIDGTRN